MAYTPELNQEESGTLRRIAWALGVPMTKALGRVLVHATDQIDKSMVCAACKDRSFCDKCKFRGVYGRR